MARIADVSAEAADDVAKSGALAYLWEALCDTRKMRVAACKAAASLLQHGGDRVQEAIALKVFDHLIAMDEHELMELEVRVVLLGASRASDDQLDRIVAKVSAAQMERLQR